MSKRREKGRLPPFVPLLKATLQSDAWRAMSHGARSLYVALKGRYNSNLGNAAYLSTRVAAKELGSHRDQIARWYRELEHFGFIVMTSAGSLGVEGKGKAPHWRLTELGYLGNSPTRDFLRWNGAPFKLTKRQNPVPETRDTPAQKPGPVVAPKPGPLAPLTGPEIRVIQPTWGDPETRDITSLTTPPQHMEDAPSQARSDALAA
jgi:hypothetical protein